MFLDAVDRAEIVITVRKRNLKNNKKLSHRFLCIMINFNREIGSGALFGKMLLVRITENNKIDAYFRSG